MAVITTGITSQSYGGNPHDASGDYALPAEVENVQVGREVVQQQPDPGKQSTLAKPSTGKRHRGKARVLRSK